jgi:hypothetical protein
MITEIITSLNLSINPRKTINHIQLCPGTEEICSPFFECFSGKPMLKPRPNPNKKPHDHHYGMYKPHESKKSNLKN